MRRLSKRKEKLANLIDTTNWENREIYCHDYGEKYVLREVLPKTVILVSSRPIAGATNSFLWRVQDVLENLRGNGVNSERKRFEMGQKIQDEVMIGSVAKVLRDDEKAIAEQRKDLDRRKVRKIKKRKKQENVQQVKKKIKVKKKVKLKKKVKPRHDRTFCVCGGSTGYRCTSWRLGGLGRIESCSQRSPGSLESIAG